MKTIKKSTRGGKVAAGSSKMQKDVRMTGMPALKSTKSMKGRGKRKM